jgi:signal transduction histidine kinase
MTAPNDFFETRRHELLGVLAHELRSPIGAILGFEELLSEGIYGSVDAKALDALARVRASARQLLQLIDGLSELGSDHPDTGVTEPALVDLGALISECLAAQQPDAENRGTTLELAGGDALGMLRTDPDRAARALQLVLAAAVKNTHGERIHVHARREQEALAIEVSGAGLAAERDDPDSGAKLNGCGLRIAMARRVLRPLHGTLVLLPGEAGGALQLRVPPLPD